MRGQSLGLVASERASLDYHYAIDVCAMLASQRISRVLVCASSSFYMREFTKRLASDATTIKLSTDISFIPGAAVNAVIWAEPDQMDVSTTFLALNKMLAYGGRLFLLTSQPLARRLPEWQALQEKPCVYPIGVRAAQRMLNRSGYTVEKLYRFNPPSAIVWGRLQVLFKWLQLNHRADRAQYRMRMSYTASGYGIGTVGVISARKW